jgi:hypothetical protein
MQAGFSAMNDLTVIQASQGFASHLLQVSSFDSIVLIEYIVF